MSKHTPGPWGHKTWDINKDGEFNYTVEKGYKSICEIVGTGEQAEANARLIAAAPDLYETLCSMIHVLTEITTATKLDLEKTVIKARDQATGKEASVSAMTVLIDALSVVSKISGETNEQPGSIPNY